MGYYEKDPEWEEYPGFDLGTKLALWFLGGLLIAMLLGLFGTIIG